MLVSLVLRRAVLIWQFGLPCLTFGTLRRPRLRSKSQPFGFDPHDETTREHNVMAIRTAFLCWLIVWLGLYVSNEQPGSSVMDRL